MARRHESSHLFFSLSGRLMRYLASVVQPLVLPVFCAWQDLAFCRRVAFEFVRNNYTRRIAQVVHELAEKALRSMSIAATLHQDIKSKTVLIDGTPKIMMPAFDRENDFIKNPFVAALRLLSAYDVCKILPESKRPLAYSFIGDDDAARSEHFFDIAETQRKTKIHPDGMADNLGRIAEAAVNIGI